MKLWEVTNGYIGESYVKCFVIAGSEEKALELARTEYRRVAGDRVGYEDDYWTDLAAYVLCEDTGREWVTGPRDH